MKAELLLHKCDIKKKTVQINRHLPVYAITFSHFSIVLSGALDAITFSKTYFPPLSFLYTSLLTSFLSAMHKEPLKLFHSTPFFLYSLQSIHICTHLQNLINNSFSLIPQKKSLTKPPITSCETLFHLKKKLPICLQLFPNTY